LETLAAALIVHEVDPGDVIFEQGSKGSSIFIVHSGITEVSRATAAEPSHPLGRVGPGEYIGEISLTTGDPRAVTMTALTHGRVLELPGESLKDLLVANDALKTAMERSVRRGLALLDRDRAVLAAHPVEHNPDLLARIREFFKV
jgi:CRP-like cAMP-binding protein